MKNLYNIINNLKLKITQKSTYNKFLNHIKEFKQKLVTFFLFNRNFLYNIFVKLKTFLIYRFNIIRIFFYKLLIYFNLTEAQILDAFFFSSIFLLFFRFFIRLFFFTNPFWYFNLGFLFLGFFLQLKINFMAYIRKFYIKILKKLLGVNYWFVVSRFDLFFADIQLKPDEFIIDINEKTKFNTFFQNLFIFFILIRLYILAHPILFFICNFFLTFSLIFFNYLLLASFFSFFLLFSRLSLFCSDYTKKDLFSVLNFIEQLEEGNHYVPNWHNSELIALVVTRTFTEPNFVKDDHNMRHQLRQTVYPRYVQINENFRNYCEYNPSMLLSVFRIASDQDFHSVDFHKGGKPYMALLHTRINRKIPCFFYKSGGWFLVWLKNIDKSNFTGVDIPHSSHIAKNHPQVFSFYTNLKEYFILRSNETTTSKYPDKSYLGPMPILDEKNNHTGYSQNRNSIVHSISEKEFNKLNIENVNKINKGEISVNPMPKGFSPNLKSIEKKEQLEKFTVSSIRNLFEQFESPTFVTVPESFNCCTSLLDPLASKEQIEESLLETQKYIELMLQNKHISSLQREGFNEMYNDFKLANIEFSNLPPAFFNSERSPFVQHKLDEMKQINCLLEIESNKPPVPKMRKYLDDKYQINGVEQSKSHIHNLHLTRKEFGGTDKPTLEIVHPAKYSKQMAIKQQQMTSKQPNQLLLQTKPNGNDIGDI